MQSSIYYILCVVAFFVFEVQSVAWVSGFLSWSYDSDNAMHRSENLIYQ